jgi:hypothetical protein
MLRPIRTVNAWNVFVDDDADDMTVIYRLRWLPRIGGAVRLSHHVLWDWRYLSLEEFARRYFRYGLAGRLRRRPATA